MWGPVLSLHTDLLALQGKPRSSSRKEVSLSARKINLEVLNFGGFIAAMCFNLVLKAAPQELIHILFGGSRKGKDPVDSQLHLLSPGS